jgi:hypothetical protein
MTRETRLWDDLVGVKRYSHNAGLLQKHDPYLIWDRAFHRSHVTFFQDQLGHSVAHPDGTIYTKTEDDTNMTLSGMVGLPLIFECSEIRFYPAVLDRKEVDRWGTYDWKCRTWKDGATTVRVPHLKAHKHLELPAVDNFTREEGLGVNRVDLEAKARALTDHVNKHELPCYAAPLKRTFHSSDYLSFILSSDKEIGQHVRTYAVLVGSMWICK